MLFGIVISSWRSQVGNAALSLRKLRMENQCGHLSCFDHDFPGNRRLSSMVWKSVMTNIPPNWHVTKTQKKTCWNMATLCQSLWIDDISVHFMHLHLTRAKVTSLHGKELVASAIRARAWRSGADDQRPEGRTVCNFSKSLSKTFSTFEVGTRWYFWIFWMFCLCGGNWVPPKKSCLHYICTQVYII